jgi:hypothetical protein
MQMAGTTNQTAARRGLANAMIKTERDLKAALKRRQEDDDDEDDY